MYSDLTKIISSPEFPWHHAPRHKLSTSGTYFLTAATYQKQHFFRSVEPVRVLHRGLLTVAREFAWQLEAWAVFSNHFVAHSPMDQDDAESLSLMLGKLHEKTAKWINRLDASPARHVWHNFWEMRLTYEKSYFARLNYVHQNPVMHGLLLKANQYPWCSAGWFERTARPAQVKTIYSFKIDRINVYDDFETVNDW